MRLCHDLLQGFALARGALLAVMMLAALAFSAEAAPRKTPEKATAAEPAVLPEGRVLFNGEPLLVIKGFDE